MDVSIVTPEKDPLALVERAVDIRSKAALTARKNRDRFAAYDEAWCVFDVDTHATIDPACREAKRQGVLIALSDPCFELWMLLHKQEQFASLASADAQTVCRRYWPNYEKDVPFTDLATTYDTAVARARKLAESHERSGVERANPSTSIYKLTERIRELGAAYHARHAGLLARSGSHGR